MRAHLRLFAAQLLRSPTSVNESRTSAGSYYRRLVAQPGAEELTLGRYQFYTQAGADWPSLAPLYSSTEASACAVPLSLLNESPKRGFYRGSGRSEAARPRR